MSLLLLSRSFIPPFKLRNSDDEGVCTSKGTENLSYEVFLFLMSALTSLSTVLVMVTCTPLLHTSGVRVMKGKCQLQ